MAGRVGRSVGWWVPLQHTCTCTTVTIHDRDASKRSSKESKGMLKVWQQGRRVEFRSGVCLNMTFKQQEHISNNNTDGGHSAVKWPVHPTHTTNTNRMNVTSHRCDWPVWVSEPLFHLVGLTGTCSRYLNVFLIKHIEKKKKRGGGHI